jgi:hypothetical protein
MQEKNTTCLACSKPLAEGGEFCPFCGTRIIPSSTTFAIDSYIQNKVSLELSNRLKDQNNLVRELGDKVEDIFWKRFRIAGLALALIFGGIGYIGWNTLDGVSKRVEPKVAAAVQRVEAAQRTIEQTATKVDAVKSSLNKLSDDVDAQTKRVTEKSGEISQKLQGFDAAITDAQKRAEAYQARSEELSRRLDVMAKTVERQATRLTQISTQVDNVAIKQTYPTLGQEKFVTYDGAPWRSAAGKPASAKWINIYIQTQGLGDYSVKQMQRLLADLKTSNFTIWLKGFGLGGPYNTGYGPLGDSNETVVFYFKKESEQMAADVCAIVSKDLSIKAFKPQFINPTNEDADRRFIIEHSGLDLQLYLLHR